MSLAIPWIQYTNCRAKSLGTNTALMACMNSGKNFMLQTLRNNNPIIVKNHILEKYKAISYSPQIYCFWPATRFYIGPSTCYIHFYNTKCFIYVSFSFYFCIVDEVQLTLSITACTTCSHSCSKHFSASLFLPTTYALLRASGMKWFLPSLKMSSML